MSKTAFSDPDGPVAATDPGADLVRDGRVVSTEPRPLGGPADRPAGE